jgi:protein-S-isoprenylcysteine O-methyltransferase Ste14
VNTAVLIIILHQLLFQGMFVAKNLRLRARLGRPIRGDNREARLAIAFFAVVIACTLGLAWSGSGFARLDLLPIPVATGIGLAFLALSLVVAALSLRDLGDSWRVGVIEEQETRLMEDGIYGFSRNPYFVAYLLMFAGYTVMLQNLLLLLLWLIGFGLVHAMVRKEEAYLERVHGQAYRDYRARVPRYILL